MIQMNDETKKAYDRCVEIRERIFNSENPSIEEMMLFGMCIQAINFVDEGITSIGTADLLKIAVKSDKKMS